MLIPSDYQNFENSASNTLLTIGATIYGMELDQLKRDLAKNLSILMERSADLRSQNALAKRSKVAQTTIGNYLNPGAYKGAPSLEKVVRLAAAFHMDAWQLIHPTLGSGDITREELQLYRKLRNVVTNLKP